MTYYWRETNASDQERTDSNGGSQERIWSQERRVGILRNEGERDTERRGAQKEEVVMWMLFVIVLEADRYLVSHQGPFASMDDCFAARQYVMQSAPQPKINYEAICIHTDHFGDEA